MPRVLLQKGQRIPVLIVLGTDIADQAADVVFGEVTCWKLQMSRCSLYHYKHPYLLRQIANEGGR